MTLFNMIPKTLRTIFDFHFLPGRIKKEKNNVKWTQMHIKKKKKKAMPIIIKKNMY